jgi:DNA recombination protein RmuC
MDLDRTLLEIGGSPVTLLHLLLVAALFALLLLVAAVILSWRAQASRQGESIVAQRRAAELEYRIAELSGALKSLVDQSQGSQIQLVSTLDERLTDQAERTGQSLKQLHERLAVIDAAQKNIAALSSEMLSLKDILSNKQARGAFGETMAVELVNDGPFTIWLDTADR